MRFNFCLFEYLFKGKHDAPPSDWHTDTKREYLKLNHYRVSGYFNCLSISFEIFGMLCLLLRLSKAPNVLVTHIVTQDRKGYGHEAALSYTPQFSVDFFFLKNNT